MKSMKHDIAVRFVKLLNVIAMTALFAACWYINYAEHVVAPFYRRGNWLVIALFMVLYIIFARVYDAFSITLSRISEIAYSQALAALVSDGIMFIVIWLLMQRFPNILPGLATLAAQVACAIIWAFWAHRWYFSTFPPCRSLVVYDVREGMEKLIDEYGLKKRFDICGIMPIDVCLRDLTVLDDVGAVFLSGIHSHDRNIILKYCMEHRVSIYMVPRIGDVLMSGAKKMHMFHLPMLRAERYNPAPEYLFLKRAFDLVVSCIAIVVLSPVMLITAIAIKASDGGPIFYKQLRLTKDGREFYITKFRSMRVDAEKDGVARLSTGENDDRITPVGRVIRKCRIDELPQLFQIASGTLSIVGPRPERPEIAAEYEKEMPEFRLRLQAKAGLTGYAQVYGKYNTTPYDKLQMDLMYIANPSIWEDLKIMFATVKILFMPESTEGVSDGQTTAMDGEQAAVCGCNGKESASKADTDSKEMARNAIK
ncbi:MAG: sugar transferase [Eubacteriales bacterium]|nr:sugar transferase [Eubacteriales bacterium]